MKENTLPLVTKQSISDHGGLVVEMTYMTIPRHRLTDKELATVKQSIQQLRDLQGHMLEVSQRVEALQVEILERLSR